MNKHQLVKEHLIKHGSITSWEAIQKYGATRLSAIIFNLRKHGYDIDTIMREESDRYGNTCQYANYVLKGIEK
ncbi:MAG: helix-turn-helix domain-containing protein [Bacilli bacterium]|nr:helix-turn-helix domain-containing protein [Bacilli bacterium]